MPTSAEISEETCLLGSPSQSHAQSRDVDGVNRRRPSTPTEREFVKHVGLEEWNDIEDMANSRVEVDLPDSAASQVFSFRALMAYAGPGFLMSIAYVDPGNLESDLQAGAYAGYQLIWVLFWATAMGFFLQILAARLGVVTGKNLAEMCRLMYPKRMYLTLWLMTEIAIIGSDIQEVLGSAIAFQILFGFPLWLGCLVTGFDTFTFLLLNRFGIRKLEAFFIALIGTMVLCFFFNFANGGSSAERIVSGFVPSVSSYAVTQAVGILGAVIMPHNIFLHSALVQSRLVKRSNRAKVHEANKYFCIESAVALLISFLINLAVLGVFAEGFFSQDCTGSFARTGVNTACLEQSIANAVLSSDATSYGKCTLRNGDQGVCQEIGLSIAGNALSGMLGEYAKTVWAIGLLAAGQSSTMAGTYAGQFVMEGFLNLHIPKWKRVLLTRCVALIPALTVAIFSQQNPGASDHMDELLNVLQSIQLPFALLPVLHFTSKRSLMGPFVNSTWMRVTGWMLCAVVCVINLYLVSANLSGFSFSAYTKAAFVILAGLYFAFIACLIKEDAVEFLKWMKKLISH